MKLGEKAVNLQKSIIEEERRRVEEGLTYNNDEIGVAIVHAREDIIAIYLRLSDACDAAIKCEHLLKIISWLLGGVIVLLALILWSLAM